MEDPVLCCAVLLLRLCCACAVLVLCCACAVDPQRGSMYIFRPIHSWPRATRRPTVQAQVADRPVTDAAFSEINSLLNTSLP
ncbi:hypothetical protein EDC01DRAFT_659937 [Geopyxis carbonaria]|nr:hypothetical protein EDC01DRAFT_659937 [Geopyxis carbonaria]